MIWSPDTIWPLFPKKIPGQNQITRYDHDESVSKSGVRAQ